VRDPGPHGRRAAAADRRLPAAPLNPDPWDGDDHREMPAVPTTVLCGDTVLHASQGQAPSEP
jgi:hypothetical protein